MKLSLLFSITLIFIVSCGSTKWGYKNNKLIEKGWVDDHTFRCFGLGLPNKNSTYNNIKKAQAKQSAILDSQYRCVNYIHNIKYVFCQSTDCSRISHEIIKHKMKIGHIVKTGMVIKATFDKKNNCKVIYQIKQKGLKKKIQ